MRLLMTAWGCHCIVAGVAEGVGVAYEAMWVARDRCSIRWRSLVCVRLCECKPEAFKRRYALLAQAATNALLLCCCGLGCRVWGLGFGRDVSKSQPSAPGCSSNGIIVVISSSSIIIISSSSSSSSSSLYEQGAC